MFTPTGIAQSSVSLNSSPSEETGSFEPTRKQFSKSAETFFNGRGVSSVNSDSPAMHASKSGSIICQPRALTIEKRAIKSPEQEESILLTDRTSTHKRLVAEIDSEGNIEGEKNIRPNFTVNMTTLKKANSRLRADASQRTSFINCREIRNNPAATIAIGVAVGAAIISAIIDISDESNDSKLLFQRSGALLVGAAGITGFKALSKRSDNLDTYNLKMDEVTQTLSRGQDVDLLRLFEEMETIRATIGNNQKTSVPEWVSFFLGLVGTLIWGYADLAIS